MVKKLAVLGIVAVMCLATMTMTACVDYGYSFHFSVVGENGEITTDGDFGKGLCYEEYLQLSCGLDCPQSSQLIRCLGGKGGQKLTLIALPENLSQFQTAIKINPKII